MLEKDEGILRSYPNENGHILAALVLHFPSRFKTWRRMSVVAMATDTGRVNANLTSPASGGHLYFCPRAWINFLENILAASKSLLMISIHPLVLIMRESAIIP